MSRQSNWTALDKWSECEKSSLEGKKYVVLSAKTLPHNITVCIYTHSTQRDSCKCPKIEKALNVFYLIVC